MEESSVPLAEVVEEVEVEAVAACFCSDSLCSFSTLEADLPLCWPPCGQFTTVPLEMLIVSPSAFTYVAEEEELEEDPEASPAALVAPVVELDS